jgi:putative N6-adenine-specific DNA methylase
MRPNVSKENATIQIDISLHQKLCKVSLDSSGKSLHMRSYRKESGLAPIMENLAFALLKIAKYDPSTPLYDLMGASATFSIEAALYAHSVFPGDLSDNFAFKRYNKFEEKEYIAIMQKLSRNPSQKSEIYYNDIVKKQMQMAELNAKRAGMHDKIHFSNSDILEYLPKSEKGLIILNPPYNERMEFESNMQGKDFFKALGNHVKKHFSGFRLALITAQDEDCKELKMSPIKRIKLFNGKIPCVFLVFEIR